MVAVIASEAWQSVSLREEAFKLRVLQNCPNTGNFKLFFIILTDCFVSLAMTAIYSFYLTTNL
jgi:hypothetical protein